MIILSGELIKIANFETKIFVVVNYKFQCNDQSLRARLVSNISLVST
jgi:hypothetical protein